MLFKPPTMKFEFIGNGIVLPNKSDFNPPDIEHSLNCSILIPVPDTTTS